MHLPDEWLRHALQVALEDSFSQHDDLERFASECLSFRPARGHGRQQLIAELVGFAAQDRERLSRLVTCLESDFPESEPVRQLAWNYSYGVRNTVYIKLHEQYRFDLNSFLERHGIHHGQVRLLTFRPRSLELELPQQWADYLERAPWPARYGVISAQNTSGEVRPATYMRAFPRRDEDTLSQLRNCYLETRVVEEVRAAPAGLVLVFGAEGSGKTALCHGLHERLPAQGSWLAAMLSIEQLAAGQDDAGRRLARGLRVALGQALSRQFQEWHRRSLSTPEARAEYVQLAEADGPAPADLAGLVETCSRVARRAKFSRIYVLLDWPGDHVIAVDGAARHLFAAIVAAAPLLARNDVRLILALPSALREACAEVPGRHDAGPAITELELSWSPHELDRLLREYIVHGQPHPTSRDALMRPRELQELCDPSEIPHTVESLHRYLIDALGGEGPCTPRKLIELVRAILEHHYLNSDHDAQLISWDTLKRLADAARR